nr:methyltransferase [Streptomyces sp. ISL-99]
MRRGHRADTPARAPSPSARHRLRPGRRPSQLPASTRGVRPRRPARVPPRRLLRRAATAGRCAGLRAHPEQNWALPKAKTLLRKAHEALPEGGIVVIYETLIDDERRENVPGLLMSLTMLLETPSGFEYTGADCREWLADAGFRESRVQYLAGPESMVIARK